MLDAALERYRRAASETNDPDLAARALLHEANALRQRCEWDRALEAARSSAEVAEGAGRVELLAEALNAEAAVHMSRGEFDSARPLLERMLALTEDARLRGIALGNLGSICAQSGAMDEAQRSFQQSCECFRRCGYRRGEAHSLHNLGRATLDLGDVPAAAEILRQAVALARAVEDGDLVAIAMLNLGEALMREGSLARAEEMASSALGFFAMNGNTWRRVEALKLLGDIHVRRGDAQTGVACYRQGLALARQIGTRPEIEVMERRVAELMGAGA